MLIPSGMLFFRVPAAFNAAFLSALEQQEAVVRGGGRVEPFIATFLNAARGAWLDGDGEVSTYGFRVQAPPDQITAVLDRLRARATEQLVPVGGTGRTLTLQVRAIEVFGPGDEIHLVNEPPDPGARADRQARARQLSIVELHQIYSFVVWADAQITRGVLAQPASQPVPPAPEPVPTPVPEPEEEPEPDSEPEEDLVEGDDDEGVPAAQQPPPPPVTTTGALPLQGVLGGTIEISSVPGGWYAQVFRNGAALLSDTGRVRPWEDRRAVGRFTTEIRRHAPDIDREVLRTALEAAFEHLRESQGSAGIQSSVVGRVIAATERVVVELTRPPTYHIHLVTGDSIAFSARDLAGLLPVTLNERWLSVYPRNPIDATRRDFEEIREHWLAIATEEPAHGYSCVWEEAAEKLQVALAPKPARPDRDGIIKYGIYLQPGENGLLWVCNSVIADVMRKVGEDSRNAGFATYLRSLGVLIRTERRRIQGQRKILWGFVPSFRPAGEGRGVVDLEGEEEGVADEQ